MLKYLIAHEIVVAWRKRTEKYSLQCKYQPLPCKYPTLPNIWQLIIPKSDAHENDVKSCADSTPSLRFVSQDPATPHSISFCRNSPGPFPEVRPADGRDRKRRAPCMARLSDHPPVTHQPIDLIRFGATESCFLDAASLQPAPSDPATIYLFSTLPAYLACLESSVSIRQRPQNVILLTKSLGYSLYLASRILYVERYAAPPSSICPSAREGTITHTRTCGATDSSRLQMHICSP